MRNPNCKFRNIGLLDIGLLDFGRLDFGRYRFKGLLVAPRDLLL